MVRYLSIFFLSFCIFPVFAENTSDIISSSDLFEPTQNSSFTFSPDGEYLAFVKWTPPFYRLQIMDLSKLEIIHNTPVSKRYLNNLTWINSSRLLYEQAGSLIAISKGGEDLRIILENHNKDDIFYSIRSYYKKMKIWELLDILPENEEEILVSLQENGYSSVYRVNIYTLEKKEIASGQKEKVSGWFVDKNGDIILGARVKEGKQEFLLRDASSNKLISHDNQQKNNDLWLNIDGSSYIKKRMLANTAAYNNDVIYVSENLDNDKFRISEYSLSKKELVKTILEDQKYDIGTPENPAELIFYKKEKKLVGVRYIQSEIYTAWIDERFQEIQTTLNKKYPNSTNIILEWTEDLSKILFYRRYNNHFGQFNLYYPSSKKIALLEDASEKTSLYTLPHKRVVNFKSRDNVEHEAYLTLPNPYNGKPLPAIIIPHGGPWSRSYLHYDPFSLFFASRGYAVLEVNYRGSTGFGRKYLLDGIKGLATLMLDDIADGANWLISSNYADPQRLFIMGESYGGYAALMSTIRYPKLYKAAVSFAAPLNLLTQINDYKDNENIFAYDFWNVAVGHVKKDKKILKEISPYHRIDDLRIPYLIMHGAMDPIVSVAQVEEFKDKLGKSTIGAIKILPQEGHGFDLQSNAVYYVEQALKHFEKHQSAP